MLAEKVVDVRHLVKEIIEENEAELTYSERKLISKLDYGLGNAKKCDYLEKALNLKRRDITHKISTLRKKGIPIASSKMKPFGYYLPATSEEVTSTDNVYSSQINDMMEVRASFRILLRKAKEDESSN